MKLGTITRAFRALWIAGFVLLLACIVLSFLEDGDVIGYDGNWLYWIAGILLVCTILSITTFLMAIVAFRRHVFVRPFRFRKPDEELAPSDWLSAHARALSAGVGPGSGGMIVGSGLIPAMRHGEVSSSLVVAWLAIALEIVCVAVLFTAVIRAIVFETRARRLRRKQELSSRGGDEASRSAGS